MLGGLEIDFELDPDSVLPHIANFNVSGAVVVLFGTLFHCWFWRQARNLCVGRLQYSLKCTDLVLSSLHAGVVTLFYLARLVGYYIWGPQIFSMWGLPHLLVNSWILGYCYMDTYDVWFHPRYYGKTKEQLTWTVHHLCLALPTLMFAIVFLTGDFDVEWWVTTGFLAEASTLPLNLSKYFHQTSVDPGRYFYIGFLLLYFVTRPLNLLGLTLQSYKIFGYRFWENAKAISVYLALTLSLMNWYWFYLLWQKVSPWPLFGKKRKKLF